MIRFLGMRILFSIAVSGLMFGLANAQDRQQNVPGQFDHYVLSLSWSPSFCETATVNARRQQCGPRPYSFVVHGLWPQYERGFPESCQVPPPRLDRRIMSSMLDLMPAPGLVFHEWDQHGTCSGLQPREYFDVVRNRWNFAGIGTFLPLPHPHSLANSSRPLRGTLALLGVIFPIP
jgi:ribonuclease T2